jgi:hypothetical protein
MNFTPFDPKSLARRERALGAFVLHTFYADERTA